MCDIYLRVMKKSMHCQGIIGFKMTIYYLAHKCSIICRQNFNNSMPFHCIPPSLNTCMSLGQINDSPTSSISRARFNDLPDVDARLQTCAEYRPSLVHH